MAYFIFLKYLRSLEEFRKNPHVKSPPKSPCANFQSLGIFKNLMFYSKRNFLQISAHPAQPCPRRPTTPRMPPSPRSAHSAQAALAYLPKGVFSLTLRTPAETSSLSHVTAMWGPPVSFIPFPTPADRYHFSSSPPATPRCPAPPSDAARAVSRPAIIPPLIPLLTSAPSSMALKPLTPPLLPLATPLWRSPDPYKRVMRPSALTAPPHCTLSPLP
jgi:hypothetical protein